MTEPKKPSKSERNLAKFLDGCEIPYLWGPGSVPPLPHPETGQPHYPDFFIPQTNLYVEVKGALTLREIRKMLRISAVRSNYYVYQATDPDWQPWVADWPSTAISPEEAKRFGDVAWQARLEYLRRHPERATRSSLSRKRHEDFHRCEVQRSEVLILSRDPTAAQAAGRVTSARLRRYLVEHIASQGWVTVDVLDTLREQAADL